MDIFRHIIFAQETAVPAGNGDFWIGGLNAMFYMFLLLVVMWFFLLRPQQKEHKRRQEMWDSLRKMDKIVTIGGIHGVITEINREKGTLTLRIDDDKNVKITIWTNCVGQVLSDE